MNPPRSTRAFSLVEMLSVIAVIGIISAIAIPQIGRVNESSRDAVAKRNAQNLVSVYNAGRAAGLDFGESPTLLLNILVNTSTGDTARGGVYNGTFFGLPGLDHEAIARAAQHVTFAEDGGLEYNRESMSDHELEIILDQISTELVNGSLDFALPQDSRGIISDNTEDLPVM